MMASRLQPPKQVRLCAIAPALVLSLLLPGPAAGGRKDTALPSLTPVDPMGASGEEARKCAELM